MKKAWILDNVEMEIIRRIILKEDEDPELMQAAKRILTEQNNPPDVVPSKGGS